MSWLSLLPPLLAIGIALVKREVILALLVAIFSAELILASGNPLLALLHLIERLTAVFADADNARILLFSLLIGALLAWIRNSGGVSAFVRWLLECGIARGPRSVSLLTTVLGVVIFIESNLSILACGTFGQSLFDRFGLSRARLALLVDATCAPVSVLILLNGWGAYILGMLSNQGLENPLGTMLAAIPLNFYALTIVLLAFYTSLSSRVHGTLARHELQERQEVQEGTQEGTVTATVEPEQDTGRPRYFLLPLLVLVGGIVGFMLYTGGGDLAQGSGARSVLYAMCLALITSYLLLLGAGVARHKQLVNQAFVGMSELLPIVAILLLAFALGAALQELQTGVYIASLLPAALPAWLLAPAVFLCACFISFSTGTSWGTFGILIPLIIPLAVATGTAPALLLAAVLSGGVFGDQASPISDSTVLSSLASGCDHVVHVRTQLPYALAAAGLSLLLFALAGLFQA